MISPSSAGLSIATLAVVAAGACSSSTAPRDGAAAEVWNLTGAHTRMVWVQHDGRDPYARGDQLVLMGLDTHDGRGERTILSERASYAKPLLTPTASRIVFTRGPLTPEPESFVVNWDGSGLKPLAKGYGLAVWADPVDGREWVYVGSDKDMREALRYDFATVTRMPIDDPSAREVVWNRSLVSGDTFQVSADGRYAGGLFPWPDAGVAELPNGSVRKLGEGCWTAMSTVRGPIMWYFDGAHRNLTLVDIRSDKRWAVSINRVPGFGNDEVYHPRWSNHPRFLAMSGPYNLGGANQVRTGGPQTEVYLGRFSADYSTVEAWTRVTRNGAGDSYPDVWIDRRRSPHDVAPPRGALGPASTDAARTAGAGSATAAPDAGRVVVEARLARAGAVPSPQAIAPYQHALVVNTYEILKVAEGTFGGKTVLVAQWAIRDRKVLPGAHRTPGSTHRLTLERYDAHPELEGERLISSSDAPDQPLYYDVGRTP
jgi:hypothetical protein